MHHVRARSSRRCAPRSSYLMITMYHKLLQIEDPSDDPRAYQQHTPRGGFDDEIPPNLGGLLGARSCMHACSKTLHGRKHPQLH